MVNQGVVVNQLEGFTMRDGITRICLLEDSCKGLSLVSASFMTDVILLFTYLQLGGNEVDGDAVQFFIPVRVL